MTAIQDVVRSGTGPATDPVGPSPIVASYGGEIGIGWQVLGWVGLALLVAALGTIATVWLPARFGNVDWEFGTVADSFVALPLLILGLGGTLASAIARGRSTALLMLGIGFVLLLIWLVASGVVFSTTAVMAYQRAAEVGGPLAVGVKRVIARTTWFGLIGGMGCVVAAWYSFKFHGTVSRRKRA